MELNIAWITVRHWDDMCTTTTDALMRGLVERGHTVTLFNSDSPEVHSDAPWHHVALGQSSVRGRKAASLAKHAQTWFATHPDDGFDVVLVDWPLAPVLGRSLSKRYRLVLIDRSPPADATLLAKFQWRSWKKAWSMLKDGLFSEGLVVSKAHQAFVVEKTGAPTKRIFPVPAGVHLTAFETTSMPENKVWKFVYHGRLDKHRGVLALPMLMQRLTNDGFDVHLTLIGNGDAFDVLQTMAERTPQLSVISSVPREEIPSHLQQHHIGLLPMPDSTVWSLASPLKRSEYLASGLLVFGVDHAGHRIEAKEDAWFRLAAQERFHEEASQWLEELSSMATEELQACSRSSRSYAEHRCSWEGSVGLLEEVLQSSSEE